MEFNVEVLLSRFASIIYEALPFIVIGVVIAGLLEEFVPQQAINRIMPRSKYLAIALGGVLGIVFPMCECGIIVVMKRLLRKGLPLGVCVCYMLAGPVINLVVMISTFAAFNQKDMAIFDGAQNVVLLRVGLSFIVAFVTALVVDWQYKKHGTHLFHPAIVRGLRDPNDESEAPKEKRTWWQSVDHITETALHDFVDIMAFLVIGAAVAVVARAWMEGSNVTGERLKEIVRDWPSVSILLMMAFAILFCLCSEADAFVAANFPLFWPPASKMAFLVLGPMLDLKLYIMYTRVFRSRLIYTIIITVVVQVFLYTTILHYCTSK